MLVHTGRFRLVQSRSRGECQAKKHALIKSAERLTSPQSRHTPAFSPEWRGG